MLIPNHPDDETLAAIAGADPDATGDRAVSRHLATCERCTTTVDELRSMTSALGELPDLAPHRPLRYLPPVAAPRPRLADRVGRVIRGIFAPALTAGAALVLVGTVGTFGPSVAPMGGSAGAAPENALPAENPEGGSAAEPSSEDTFSGASASDGSDRGAEAAVTDEASPTPALGYLAQVSPSPEADSAPAAAQTPSAPADWPVWPMVLFSGVVLIVAALFLRWTLVPRAG